MKRKHLTILTNGTTITHSKPLKSNGTSNCKPFAGRIVLPNGYTVTKRKIELAWNTISLQS